MIKRYFQLKKSHLITLFHFRGIGKALSIFLLLILISDLGFSQVSISSSPSPATICNGGTVTLTASNATTYTWAPATGLSSTTGSIVTANPSTTTTYTVTGIGGCGTSCTASITVSVNPLPTITTSATAASVCYSASTQTALLAYSATTNNPSTYSITWNASPPNSFLAVTNATLPISPITINVPAGTNPGTYTGTITVKNSNGCVSLIRTFTLTVNPIPLANFSFSPNSPCSNVPVIFTNSSTGTGLTYLWNFGDPGSGSQNTSALINPTHTFNANFGNGTQNFIVTLTATSSSGCQNTITHQVTVKQIPDASISDDINSPQFTNCGNGIFNLIVTNISSTTSTNTNYSINWGDATAIFTSSTWALNSTTTHTYTSQGYFTITVNVTGQNGCISTKTYTVYNGSNPSLTFPNPGNTTGHCAPYILTIPILGTTGNPPGTVYIITTNDPNIPSVTYNHPPPANYTCTFTTSSCGASANGSGIPNSFYINCTAQNPCGITPQPVWPITTGIAPSASFSISPDTIACINTVVNFTNTSQNGSFADAFGNCNSINPQNWIISPSTGWTISNGSLGNPNPTNNSSTWGSNTLGVTFTTAGTYNVSLIVRNVCGNDTVTKTVCIQSPLANPTFTLNPILGCKPLNVTATGTIPITQCIPPTFDWSVNYAAGYCGTTSSWSYTGGANTYNPSFVFNNSGTYTITLTETNRCGSATTNHTVIVKAPPIVSLNTIPDNCGPLTISPTAVITNCGTTALTYSWLFGGGTPSSSTLSNPSVIFSSAGPHTISLGVTNECNTTNASTSFNINPIPTVTVNNAIICAGQSATLTANPSISGGTYLWTPGGATTSSITVIPGATTSYNLVYTLPTGCSSSVSSTVTVNSLPNVSVNSPTICIGQTATLTANGANSYTWSDGTTINPKPVSPANTTTYTVTGINTTTGCTNTAIATVTVNPLPTVTAGPSIQACNQPIPVTLAGYLPAGGTWSGTGVTSSGIFTPTSTGIFILTYSYTNSTTQCSNQDTMTVTVVNPQIANAGTGFSRCINAPIVTLMGYSPPGGTWSGTGVIGNTFNPATAGVGNFVLTYSFGGANCLTTDTIHVTVNTLPNVSVNSPTICIGQTVTLTANGANSYTWSDGTTINPKPVSPGNTTTYTVTGTNTTTGCTNTAIATVTVNPLPTVTAGPSIQACNQPIPVTLAGYLPAGGTWSGTGVTSSGIFTPTSTGIFILTYSYTNPTTLCSNQDTMTVTVVNPQIANAGTGFSRCINAPIVTLAGYSPLGGTWSGTGVTGNTFNPATAGVGNFVLTYSFGGANCLTTDTIHVRVNSLPTVSVNSPTICIGQTATLTANGANSYTWSDGTNINPKPVSPANTTTYIVTGTNTTTGCTNTAIATVTVNPLPTVTAGPSIQACNQPIPVTLTGYLPAGGTWSGTGVTSSGIFTPTLTGIFILTYSYTNPTTLCSNQDTMTVTVVSPQIANAGTGFSRCINAPIVTLTGYSPPGGTWTGTGVIGNTFNPATAGTGNFVLTYSFGGANCLTTDTIHVTVNSLPNVSVNSPTICIGQTATLTANGANSYTWSDGTTINPKPVSPANTTTYTVTGINTTTGCTNTAIATVTVNPLPTVTAGPSIQACNQPIPVTLAGYLPAGGTWSGTGVTSSGIFTPTSTGIFILTYSYTNSTTQCSNQDTMTVTVVNPQIANAGTGFSRCINAPIVTLMGYSPPGGTWSGTGVIGNTFNPATAGVGNFVLTYSFGGANCLTTDTIHVTVNTLPNVSVNSPTICIGQTVTLTANGANSYTWSDGTTINPKPVSPGNTTTYTVTGTNTTTGCTNTAIATVTVNPLPTVTAGPSIQACNQPIPVTLTGYLPAGGTWSGTGVTSSGIFTPTSTGTFILTYSYTNPTTLCSNQDTMTVTVVNPQIAIAGTGFSRCINAPIVTLMGYSPPGGTWSGTGVTGNTFNPATAGTGNFVLTYSFGASTCLTIDTINVTVYPSPIVYAGNYQSICEGGSVILSGSVSGSATGGSWNSSIGGTFIPDSNTLNATWTPPLGYTGTAVLTLTTTGMSPCSAISSLANIIVNPDPTINFQSMDSIICTGTSAALLVSTTGGFGTFSYQWQSSVIGCGSGWTNIPGATNSTYNPVLTDTTYFQCLISQSGNGCNSIISSCAMIEVVEAPNAQFSAIPQIGCAPFIAMFNNTSSGYLVNNYAWDFGNGIYSNLQYPAPVNYAQGTIDTSYIITLLAGNICGTDICTDTITVIPIPNIPDQTDSICSGQFSFVPQNSPPLTLVPQNTTYTWGMPILTSGLTGGAIGNSQPSISGTLVNSTDTIQTATYIIIARSGSFQNCIADTFTLTIYVFPIPVIQSRDTTICSGNSFNIMPSNNPPTTIVPVGTTYSWPPPVLSGNISGGFAGSNQSSISGTLINNTDAVQTATYTVTPSFGGCPGNNFIVTVTINPAPLIPNQTISICSGDTFTLNLVTSLPTTIIPVGTTYSWQVPNVTAGVTGGAAGSNQSFFSGTLINPTDDIQTAVYTVTPATTFPCPGNAFTVIVTIKPRPVIPSDDLTICSESFFEYTPVISPNTIIPIGTTYAWSAPVVTGGMTGGVSGINQLSIQGLLFNPTNTPETAIYNITPAYDSCDGMPFTLTVTVNPKPIAGFTYINDHSSEPFDGTIIFTNTSQFASTYYWNFGDDTEGFYDDLIFSHRYFFDGTQIVSLIANNIYNCPDTAKSPIVINPFCGLFIPNAFSPTGLNEEVNWFKAVGYGLKEFNIQVFDTWGTLLWESSEIDSNGIPTGEWDGTFKGKELPADVYVWKARGIFKNNEVWKGMDYDKFKHGTKNKMGTVTLIR